MLSNTFTLTSPFYLTLAPFVFQQKNLMIIYFFPVTLVGDCGPKYSAPEPKLGDFWQDAEFLFLLEIVFTRKDSEISLVFMFARNDLGNLEGTQ